LASGKGILKTARELKVGSGTVQGVKAGMVKQGLKDHLGRQTGGAHDCEMTPTRKVALEFVRDGSLFWRRWIRLERPAEGRRWRR
jgi:hypothetical protein